MLNINFELYKTKLLLCIELSVIVRTFAREEVRVIRRKECIQET